jgi:DNA-binding MarR family transcriptional regulator
MASPRAPRKATASKGGARRPPVDPTPWLSPEELDAWFSLVALTVKVPPALDAQLQRDVGINHFEYGVLAALSENPGRTLRMSELAGFANGSPSRLSHAVRRLEERGWVERHPAADNGRVIEAHLTDAGWEAIVEAAPSHVREARRLVIDALTPAQITQLSEIGRAVLAATDPETLSWLDSRERD